MHGRLRAAAPSRVAASLEGPLRRAPVIHRGTDATYVDLDGRALGVLSARATAVPCGLRTAESQLPAQWSADASLQAAEAGGGRLLLGSVEVICTRVLDAGMAPRPGLDLQRVHARLAETLAGLGGDAAGLDAVRDELPAEALDLLTRGEEGSVALLLGRGSGLTPVGDDVLCGWLAVQTILDGQPDPVRTRVADLAPRLTTTLSATLLDCADHGELIPEFRRLLLGLVAPGQPGQTGGRLTYQIADQSTGPPTSADTLALLRVGHTSGAGLLLGAVLALRHLTSWSLAR